MPIYEYEGVTYDIETTNHEEAKAKILAHLGKSQPQKPALDTPAINEFGNEIVDRGKAALGGLEWAGSMISAIPSFVGGGLLGAFDPRYPLDERGQAVRDWQEKIPSYRPQTEYGKVAGEAFEHLRDKYGRLAETELAGDQQDRPFMRTMGEVSFDLGTMGLPGRYAPRVAEPITTRRPPTPQERAIAEAELARQEGVERQAAEQAKQEGLQRGDQMEITMPEQTPLYEPPQVRSPEPKEMMDRLNEILESKQREKVGPQADLFEEIPKTEFPGTERTQELRAAIDEQKNTTPFELSLVEDESTKVSRAPEQGIDAPFAPGEKLANLESDPYFSTLKQEFDKHMEDYVRNQHNKERADAYGQTPRYAAASREQRARYDNNARKALEKANEALRNANEVWNEAKRYYDQRLKDLQIGRLTAKNDLGMGDRKGLAPKIEKTFSARKVGGWTPKKQRGATRMDFMSAKWTIDTIKKWLDEAQKRAHNLEKARDMSQSGEQAAIIDDRLEKLYYEMMRANNELLRRSDPKHPLHHLKLNEEPKLGDIGPGKKQRGGPDKDANKKMIERIDELINMLEDPKKTIRWDKVNPKGFDFGGFPNLPESLKEWITEAAQVMAIRKLEESGVDTAEIFSGKLGFEEAKEYQGYVEELLNDPDFVKQAIANSLGYNSGRVGPIAPLGSKGKYGKQKGSIGFDEDPEFLKFKDSLPDNMKQFAKGAWREMEKIKEARLPNHYGKRIEPILKDQAVVDTMNEIPGLKDWKDMLLPILKTPEELKPVVLKEPDLSPDFFSRLGRQLVSGGKILGLGTQNTLIRYTAQGVDRVMREAQQFIEDKLLNKNYGLKTMWEKLSKDEQGHVWTELLQREGMQGLSRQDMFDLGFNEKQVNAAESLRRALDKTYELLNTGRAAQGKGPITQRPGYIPSRFRGDFVVHVRDAEGKLVHIMGANTIWGARNLKKWLESQPESANLKIGEAIHEPLHRFKDASDAQAGYQMMIDALTGEDPLVAALEQAYDRYLQKQSYDALGTKKHFLHKTEVKGAEGNKAWKDAYDNAQEGLRSIMNYIDHAAKWSFTQIELKNARTLLKDKEVQKAQPVAAAWAQSYVDQALGRSTKMARALDTVVDQLAEQTGWGQSLMVKGIRDTKYFMTAMYLGFLNAGFSLSQIVQVVQTQPALMMTFKGLGAEGSILGAYARGNLDAIKGMSVGADKMTVLGRQAWDYANEKGIVEPKILDDARALFAKDINKALEGIATWNMTQFEKIARTQAYLTWVHFLHESGLKMGKELYEAAGQMTDITMVDYRMHERPMLYKQLGIIGEAANALTTFKHNYYSQAWLQHQLNAPRMLPDGTKKGRNYGPEATFYSTLLMLGGLLSILGREDVDVVINMLNKVSGARIPTTRELILRTPNVVAFGPASALSGLDVSSKFSAANVIPDDAITAAFPFAGTLADIGGAAAGFVKDPSITSAMRLSQQVSPTSTRWLHEDYFKRGDITLNPRTMEGQYRRTETDEAARKLALRTIPESREAHASRTNREQDQFYAQKRASVLDKAKDRAFEGKLMEVAELGRKYVQEYEGTPQSFTSEVLSNVKEQHRTQLERMLWQSMGNPQKLKRRMGGR